MKWVSCCHNNNTTRSKASVVAYSPTWLKQSTKQNNGEAWQGLFSVHIQRVFLRFVCLLVYTSQHKLYKTSLFTYSSLQVHCKVILLTTLHLFCKPIHLYQVISILNENYHVAHNKLWRKELIQAAVLISV